PGCLICVNSRAEYRCLVIAIATLVLSSEERCRTTMSSRIQVQLEDIARYIEGIREQKRVSEQNANSLRSERQLVSKQMEQLQTKLELLNRRIEKEEETVRRLQECLDRADGTYEKLIESSQSLIDFVKKEYHEAKKPTSDENV
uniref:Uncharacterized protein n=1 Tax=Parascaris univalens TaxID=6257 RepID=A0A914ZUQ1_PARUN